MSLNQFCNRLPQERFTAERHAQSPELSGDDLIFRPAIAIGNHAGAFGKFLGDAGDFLFGNIAIVAIVVNGVPSAPSPRSLENSTAGSPSRCVMR